MYMCSVGKWRERQPSKTKPSAPLFIIERENATQRPSGDDTVTAIYVQPLLMHSAALARTCGDDFVTVIYIQIQIYNKTDKTQYV